MNNYGSPKSATTAGLLGIFLGSVGAHCWYLGDKKKGIIHVCLAGSGIIFSILSAVILPAVMSWSALITYAWVFTILGALTAAALSGNAIWGLVEGIIILSQGDAGLARKGYLVATPVQPNYGYQQPYQQPMQQQSYQQPMQQQPYYDPNAYQQPMQQQPYYDPNAYQQPMQQQPYQQPMQDNGGDMSNGQ